MAGWKQSRRLLESAEDDLLVLDGQVLDETSKSVALLDLVLIWAVTAMLWLSL